MSDLNKETQASKIVEIFEKENFRKNSLLTSSILNQATNTIHIFTLSKEKSLAEIGLDQKSLEDILKREELKTSIIYNQQENTVAPAWKRLRNILYLTNFDKEQKQELCNLIEQVIKTVTTDYKIEPQNQTESIKITVTTPNQEEAQTKVLFDKLFMKAFSVHDAQVSLHCAIEEEQFATPSNIVNYPAQGKGNRNFKGQVQGAQFVSKNGAPFNNNNNTKISGNNLHQPTSNSNNYNNSNNNSSRQNNNINNKAQNIKGGKLNKQNFKGKQSQRVFNPNDNDFPVLQ